MSLGVHLPHIAPIVLRLADRLGPAARHSGERIAQSLPPEALLPSRGDARRARAEVVEAAERYKAGRRDVRERTEQRPEIAKRDLAARADAAADGRERPQPELPAHDRALVELAEEVAVLSGVLDRKIAVWEAVLRDEHAAIEKHVRRRVHAARAQAVAAVVAATVAIEEAEAVHLGAQRLGVGVGEGHPGFARELRDRARAVGLGNETKAAA